MIRKALAYYWDAQQKKIEKIWQEAENPYAKIFNKVFGSPLVGQRRMVPKRKKDSTNN